MPPGIILRVERRRVAEALLVALDEEAAVAVANDLAPPEAVGFRAHAVVPSDLDHGPDLGRDGLVALVVVVGLGVHVLIIMIYQVLLFI